jgi:anti-sigma factor RsiW
MKEESHLTDGLLVKALDGELTGAEKIEVEIHLADCPHCLERLDRWAEFSTEIARVVDSAPAPVVRQSHERLLRALANAQESSKVSENQSHRGRALAWLGALAACLALAALLSIARHSMRQNPVTPATQSDPDGRRVPPPPEAVAHVRPDQPVKRRTILAENHTVPAKPHSVPAPASDGFWPLPYSNPALPVDSADVLRVRVRLSALSDVGVVRSSPGVDDPWVQADVLLGADGEPRGIRLLQASATQ